MSVSYSLEETTRIVKSGTGKWGKGMGREKREETR